MASLNHLPFEILTNIISRLRSKDLISTCRVSRNLQLVAESVLYRSITLSPKNLRWFVYTLLTPGREILAAYVFGLQLRPAFLQYLPSRADDVEEHYDDLSETSDDGSDSTEADSNGEYPADYGGHPDDPVTFLARIAHHRAPEHKQRFETAVSRFEIRCRSTQLPFLVLLHLLPNLMSPTITFPLHVFTFMEYFTATPVPGLPVPLLRHFRNFEQGVSPAVLCALLKLPCISTIQVHIIETPYNYGGTLSAVDTLWPVDKFRSVPSGTSTVTTLQLDSNSLSPDSFSHILSTPRALQVFSYESDIPHNIHFDLARSILPHQNSLRELTFRCRASSVIGSLLHWPKLQVVNCSLTTLVGESDTAVELIAVLPLRTKELEIICDDYWSSRKTVEILLRLLARKKDRFLALESISISGDEERDEEVWLMLEAPCLEATVTFMYDNQYFGR